MEQVYIAELNQACRDEISSWLQFLLAGRREMGDKKFNVLAVH